MRRTKRGGWPYSQPPSVPFEINLDSPQSEGLVAWWPMLASRGTGGLILDLASGRFPMAQFNTPTWVSDPQHGWVLSFTAAANEYLRNANGIVTGYPVTLACWFKADDLDARYVLMALHQGNKDFHYRRLEADGFGGVDNLVARERSGGASRQASCPINFVANTWHHATAVYIGQTSRAIYQDGGNKGTNADDAGAVNAPTTVDIGAIFGGEYLNGDIADARIYNRALTDTEVWQLCAEPWELYKPLIRRFLGWSPPPPTTTTTTLAPTTTSTSTLPPTTSTTTLAPTTTSTSTLPPTTTSTSTLPPTTTSTSTLPPTTTSTSTLPPTTTSTSTLPPTTSTTTLAPTTTSTSTLPPTTTSTSTLPPTTTSTSTLLPTTTSTSTLPPTTTSTSTLLPTTTSTSTLLPTTTSTSTLPPTTSTTTLAPTTSTSTSTLPPETTTSTSTLSTTTVSTTSTLTVTTTTLPPVPAVPAPTTPTLEQSLSLTLNVFKPDFSTGTYEPRDTFVTSLQEQVNSYSHTVNALGGYWSAKFTVLDKQADMEVWLTDGLGRHIEVYDNALVKIWEGFVNQVDLTLGGLTATRGPLMDVGNRVRVVYSGTNTETDPPVQGNRVMTAAVNDLESQGRYGIIEQILSAGGMTLTDAEQARDSYMAENSEPKTIQKLGSGGGLNVSVSCLGYVHWFNYLISLVGVEGTVNLDTKLERILDADPNGLFASSNSNLMPNTLQVSAYDNKSQTAWDAIKGLVVLGDEADTRYTFGVYADRHVTYQPTNQDEIAYRYFPGDPARRIESATGGHVWPWNVLPGRWMFFPSFLIGRTFPDDWRKDPRFMFIESVTFRLPHTLQLQGGRLDTIPQKLAKMGLAGIGS